MGETGGENWPSKIRRLVTKKNVARVVTGAVVTTGAIIAGQHVDRPSVPAEGLTDANPPRVLPVSEVELPRIQAEEELRQNPVITEQKPIELKAEKKATEEPKADPMARIEQQRYEVQALIQQLCSDNPYRSSQENRALQELFEEAWKQGPESEAAKQLEKYKASLTKELELKNNPKLYVEERMRNIDAFFNKRYPQVAEKLTIVSQEKRYLQQLLDEVWKKDPTGKAAVKAIDDYFEKLLTGKF